MARDDVSDLAETYIECKRCRAQPGQVCVTVNGKRASYTHSSRERPAMKIWLAGYIAGRNDRRGLLARAWDQGHQAGVETDNPYREKE